MPGRNLFTMRDTSLDLKSGHPYSYETTATLLAEFDQLVAEARAAIAAASDADFQVP
jgi:hypothetical protein